MPATPRPRLLVCYLAGLAGTLRFPVWAARPATDTDPRPVEAPMPGLMFDSDDVSLLLSATLAGCRLASYADLVTPQLYTAAAGHMKVIDRGLGDPHGLATIADIEPGCLTVDAGTAKIRQWVSEGRHQPTAYHDRNDWTEVDFKLQGVAHFTWVATLDGEAAPDGRRPDAVQILGEAKVGLHVDMSIVWNDKWFPLPSGPTQAQVNALKAAYLQFTSSGPRLAALIDAL